MRVTSFVLVVHVTASMATTDLTKALSNSIHEILGLRECTSMWAVLVLGLYSAVRMQLLYLYALVLVYLNMFWCL